MDLIQIAYKKLKGAVYFDKTQLPLVEQIASYETEDIDEKLERLWQMLTASYDTWEQYVSQICEEINAFVYPKKLRNWMDNQVIFNTDNEPVELQKAQYFIDMPVEGHILGVLWILTIGVFLDNRNDDEHSRMYEHSYGNRLRKKLYNPESGSVTSSPYLFEPYFAQYERWRDNALQYAKERLDEKQDALILTLDLKSFFYSVHISKKRFDGIYTEYLKEKSDETDWIRRVHQFVYSVMERYSEKIRDLNRDNELILEDRVFLPIGFLPSNILSNWFLAPFDEKIIERINPVYYGRYVDDIIIVDKVEKNSPIRKKAVGRSRDGSILTAKDVMQYYFCSCPATKEFPHDCGCNQLLIPIERINGMVCGSALDAGRLECEDALPKDSKVVYRINPDIFRSEGEDESTVDIRIQNDKVKVFYFREGATRSLIDSFRAEVARNSSEFRFLPDMETTLIENDYSEIFKLSNDETPHKLRGVSSVKLDKFSLSKFLGKYRKAGNMIKDKKETAFDKELSTFLSRRTLIENYSLWERLLEIMIINDQLSAYERIIKNIIEAICSLECPEEIVASRERMRRGLAATLRSAICRTAALYWGKRMETLLAKIEKIVQQKLPEEKEVFQLSTLHALRISFCRSCMVNKYILQLPTIWLDHEMFLETDESVNLCHFEQLKKNINWSTRKQYMYSPYIVTPQDISFALVCKDIACGENIANPCQQKHDEGMLFERLNGYESQGELEILTTVKTKQLALGGLYSKERDCYAIAVDSPQCKKIKVAIGNARLRMEDFENALLEKPNRSLERYQQIVKLMKSALEEHADILVLPESFLPMEWIPDISRLCANNQMALVTGIEHALSSDGGKVYNLTAVILPYCRDDYKFAHVVYHHKVHYSPEEKRLIAGYRMTAFEGNEYQLFCWKDIWFSVYCCFELASIAERALFQDYADLIVVVEWNRDVTYFSNVVESLSRDLHCYCIQVNSADYGDSRVIAPAKTERRDIIKTKGGVNYTVLTDEIDIEKLRIHQCKEYELQKEDKSFKPTPPNHEPDISLYKQKGILWEKLNKK